MKNLILHFLFGSIASIIVAQEYDISECINIALDRKGTIVSAGLDVESANQGVKAVSYTHLTLPTTPYV